MGASHTSRDTRRLYLFLHQKAQCEKIFNSVTWWTVMYFVLKFLEMYVQPMLNMDITVNYLMLFVQVKCPHCYITCMLLRSTAGHDWFSKGRLPHPQNRIISQVPPLQVLDPNFQLGCMEVHCQEKVGNLITC